jgi:ribosomal protein S18 acetylase RimI-like enzyme
VTLSATANVRIRALTADDAETVGEIWASARAVAYAGIVPDEIARRPATALSEGLSASLAQPGHFGMIAIEGDESLGFVEAGPPDHSDDLGDAEIYLIYVDPKAQARGVGRLLMRHAAERLRDSGARTLFLWTLRDNLIGRSFYDRLGGSVLREVWTDTNKNFLVAYVWRDLDALIERTR